MTKRKALNILPKKGVILMMYSFTCPAPGCGHVSTVDANTDDEAVDKFMAVGALHAKEVHPEMPAMPEEQMRGMVRSGMKKM